MSSAKDEDSAPSGGAAAESLPDTVRFCTTGDADRNSHQGAHELEITAALRCIVRAQRLLTAEVFVEEV